MDLNEMNEDWSKDAPTLAAMEKANPFKVPDGYFEEASAQLHSRIALSRFEVEDANWKVPDGYFEKLEDQILSAVKLSEIKDHHRDQNVLDVPEGYFEFLESKIHSRITGQTQKIQTPKVRGMFNSWIAYAAAACVTAVLGVSLYFNQKPVNVEAKISQLPSEEIVDYLQLYSDAGDAPVIANALESDVNLSEIKIEASNQEIEQYLKSNM